ncbi:hypothetical protein BD413DRAFT_615638 [Trametes elegans]|nr:hypothetical protein BD413DRAFT_615638 [Trametes elegans]
MASPGSRFAHQDLEGRPPDSGQLPAQETPAERWKRNRKRTPEDHKTTEGTTATVSSSSYPSIAYLCTSGIQAHPSLKYWESPLCDVPAAWARALKLVGDELALPQSSVLYLYPPPFLLVPPNYAANVESARNDERLHRYLHNLVRIRGFCRHRDYPKKPPPAALASVPGGKARRWKTDIEGRNEVAQHFFAVGTLRTYFEADAATLGDLKVTKNAVTTDLRVQYLSLWQAHGFNWRCELLALDEAFLPRNK